MKRKIITSGIILVMFLFILKTQVYGMQIFIKKLDGRDMPLEVESSDTIEAVKAKIEKEIKIPVERQKLVWDGIVLEEGRTLGDYNIQKENTIKLIYSIIKYKITVNATNATVKINDEAINEIEVESDSNKILTIAPSKGYKITTVKVNNLETELINGTLQLNKIKENKNIEVLTEKIEQDNTEEQEEPVTNTDIEKNNTKVETTQTTSQTTPKKKIKNPQTGDNIISYVIVLAIALTGVIKITSKSKD